MSFLLERFRDNADKIAIIDDGKSYTYGDLLEGILDLSSTTLKGIKNKVVAIIGGYSFYNIALFLALYENKNTIVPLVECNEAALKESMADIKINAEILEFPNLEFPKLEFLETNDKKHAIIENLFRQNHAGLVLFSSGSTGKPKAMIHNLDTLISIFETKKPRKINMLLFLLFDHIGGINTLLNILATLSTAIIPRERNSDEICALIEKYKISVLPSNPTFLNLILMSNAHKKYDLSSLKMITYGTEAMSESLLARLKATFKKVKFLQTFGTSETGILNTSSKSGGSTYIKLNDAEYKIVNGELWIKSKTQILGYLNADMSAFKASFEDGWFKTGDLVLRDGEYLKIVGRSKELINIGGKKALPSEIESVIMELENIADCVVYGEQNAITGQSVSCDVVLKNTMAKDELKKLIRSTCASKLERYKIPSKINVVEKIAFTNRFKKVRA
ncbi:MAG: fatty acid--CoA ligase family protein [Campylobacter sp.]|uniref:ANL family adenylate-forming protein n=1 Tax=Campylobacter sp. TaxID=205 RepID=UPI002A808AAB|nr:fatty acid--CoA ligase family protein [Campylobacter sp.]MDY5115019.1 fatty acid--CoA ligase family protein [Campylobacter sp.]